MPAAPPGGARPGLGATAAPAAAARAAAAPPPAPPLAPPRRAASVRHGGVCGVSNGARAPASSAPQDPAGARCLVRAAWPCCCTSRPPTSLMETAQSVLRQRASHTWPSRPALTILRGRAGDSESGVFWEHAVPRARARAAAGCQDAGTRTSAGGVRSGQMDPRRVQHSYAAPRMTAHARARMAAACTPVLWCPAPVRISHHTGHSSRHGQQAACRSASPPVPSGPPIRLPSVPPPTSAGRTSAPDPHPS